WVHYKLAALDEPVLRVLMSAVTHVLSHCDAVGKDRQRLEAQTGWWGPPPKAASRPPGGEAAKSDAPAENACTTAAWPKSAIIRDCGAGRARGGRGHFDLQAIGGRQ